MLGSISHVAAHSATPSPAVSVPRVTPQSVSSDPVITRPAVAYQFGVTTVAISDTLVFYGEEKALDIVDVSNPSAPVLRSRILLPRIVYELQVVGHFAYVVIGAEEGEGLQIIDISDPDHPVLRSVYPLVWAMSVQVNGSLAYVGTGRDGLFVLNISDPDHPSLVGKCCDGVSIQALQVSGNRAYIGWYSALRIVDVSNPASPTVIGNFSEPEYIFTAIRVVGDRVYLGDDIRGIDIIDASNPAQMTRLGQYWTQGGALDLEISGSYVYVATGLQGLEVVDISNPANPVLRQSYPVAGLAQSIALASSYAYVAGGEGGLQTLDISNADQPRLLSKYFIMGNKDYLGLLRH
jgi:hypothetical protein